MATTMRLEVVVPRVLAGAGVMLVLLAFYMAGSDSINCRRSGNRVDCRVWRSRVLGQLTVEDFPVRDVVDAWVRTTTTSEETYRSGRGTTPEHTQSNNTLILHTRDGRDVATLGGEQSASYASQVIALVKSAAVSARPADPSLPAVEAGEELTAFTTSDSYLPVALFCAGLGAVIAIFGFLGMRFA